MDGRVFNFCMLVWSAGWAAFDLSQAHGGEAAFSAVCGGIQLACCALFLVLLIEGWND